MHENIVCPAMVMEWKKTERETYLWNGDISLSINDTLHGKCDVCMGREL